VMIHPHVTSVDALLQSAPMDADPIGTREVMTVRHLPLLLHRTINLALRRGDTIDPNTMVEIATGVITTQTLNHCIHHRL
jgi:hypothetical protein